MTVILPVANVLVASVGYPLIHFGRCTRLRIFPFPSSQTGQCSGFLPRSRRGLCYVVLHTSYCIP